MEFNKYFDHTFLKAFATKEDIDTLCAQAKELDTVLNRIFSTTLNCKLNNNYFF